MRCATRARCTSSPTSASTALGAPAVGWFIGSPASGKAASLRLQIRFLGELGPFDELEVDDLAERIGRPADAFAALREQLLLDLRLGDDRIQRLVEALDDRLRRLRRNE